MGLTKAPGPVAADATHFPLMIAKLVAVCPGETHRMHPQGNEGSNPRVYFGKR